MSVVLQSCSPISSKVFGSYFAYSPKVSEGLPNNWHDFAEKRKKIQVSDSRVEIWLRNKFNKEAEKKKKMERKKRKSVQSSSGKNIDPMSASHFYELFCEVFEVQATRNHWWFSSLPSPSLWKEIPTPRAAATSDHLEEELSGLIISL